MWIIDKIIEGVSRAIDTNPLNALWVIGIGLAAVALLVVLAVLICRLVAKSYRNIRATIVASRSSDDETAGERVKLKIDPVTLAVALVAFAVSGEGMWRFFGEKMGLSGSPLRLGFVVLEAMAFACALRIRRKAEAGEPAGADWWIMWGIAFLSGAMSATDANNGPEAVLRFIMPLIAGVAWELALSGARNLARERIGERVRERSRAVLALTPKRLLIKLGWMDASGRSLDEVTRERVITRAALMSDRYLALKEAQAEALTSGERSWWARRQLMSARKSAHKRVRIAVEQAGLGTDPISTNMFMYKMSVLRKFEDLGTALFENPWKVTELPKPQVSEQKAITPPPAPKPSRRQNGKITPARGKGGVPQRAVEYWVEVTTRTGEPPTTQQLIDECGAGSQPTARRWASKLRKMDVSALMSAHGGPPKALTSVNGSTN